MTIGEIRSTIKDLVAEAMCEIDVEDVVRQYLVQRVAIYFDRNDIETDLLDDLDTYANEEKVDNMIRDAIIDEIGDLRNDIPF